MYHLVNHGINAGEGWTEIVAHDLDTGDEASRQPLVPRAVGGYGNPATNLGARQTVAVDSVGARLFVAYAADADAIRGTTRVVSNAASRGEFCAMPASTSPLTPIGCVGGVQTLDARTLQRTGPLMPLRLLSASGVPLAPQLLSMEYVASGESEQSDKLLLLVADFMAHGGTGAENNPRIVTSHAPTYVVQLDVNSGAQDWVVQLDACRGSRESRNVQDSLFVNNRGGAGVVYRVNGSRLSMVMAGCHGGSSQIGTLIRIPLDMNGDPAGLPVAVRDAGEAASEVGDDPKSLAPQMWIVPAASPLVTVGPDRVVEMLADPHSNRVLLKVVAGTGGELAEVWWVFDGTLGQFAGTIGIGAATLDSSNAALDPIAGRLYVLSPDTSAGKPLAGGLFVADIRRTPVPQALVFPEFASMAAPWGQNKVIQIGIEVRGDIRRIYVPDARQDVTAVERYRILDDRLVVLKEDVSDPYAGRTLDLGEIEGVTESVFDGAARGYSVRALLVGGAEAATRGGPADPLGDVLQCNYSGGYLIPSGSGGVLNLKSPCGSPEDTASVPGQVANLTGVRKVPGGLVPVLPEQCITSNPEIVLGFVGPDGANVVDASGARGGAEPVRLDSATAADLEAPVSRCSGADWEDIGTLPVLGGIPLLGANGIGEPKITPPWSQRGVQCVSSEEGKAARSGDPVVDPFAAGAQCEQEESSGFAYVRGNQIGDVGVAEALSSFRIYRDPGRGVVSRVESVARGVNIAGVVRIAAVRGVAESWANGRKFTPPVLEEARVYDPNCDMERTAGTCFTRHLFGVSTPGYSCGPCGDERRLLDGLNRALGANGKATLRDPDPDLARGADNGFIAAITKRPQERFSDLVLNNDLMQTVLPTLEIIRYTAANRIPSGGGPRGRQIYQFAGVEVSSSYGIACLLVYDEAANTCGLPAEPPGAIQVSLSESDGGPLAGGAFEVRADVDADGVLGLKDTLLPDGACVTADDGVGTCRLENLQPGSYLVSQVAAPPGYAKSAEPFVVELASGEQRTVAFTNVSNVSTIDLKATDESGAPLSGAVFAAYPDPDSDGKVAPEATPAAECATDGQGACQMKVPAGSYVLVQTGAPAGLEGIEPVPFTFASGGQVAAVTVVNYPPQDPGVPETAPAAAPIDYTTPVGYAPPVESVDPGYQAPAVTDSPPAPQVSLPDQIGGTVVRVIRAPGDALRLLARDPQQALAWTAALALFCLAAMAIRRRQHALTLLQG